MVERTELATRLGRWHLTSTSMISTFGPRSPHFGNTWSGESGAEGRLPPPNGHGIELPAARECTKPRPAAARRIDPRTGRPAAGGPGRSTKRRQVSSNVLLGGAFVPMEPVVLGPGVQPHVEPGNAEPRGADPKRVVADMRLDGTANRLPQGVTLALRRRPQEGSQVGIGRTSSDWEGN